MTANEAKSYFDQITEAPEGAKLRIPCESTSDMNSARTQFYRQRLIYRAGMGTAAKNIGIQQLTVSESMAEELGAKYFVVLHVTTQRASATMQLPDGTTEQFNPTLVEGNGLSASQNRAYQFMIADGMDEAEALAAATEM